MDRKNQISAQTRANLRAKLAKRNQSLSQKGSAFTQNKTVDTTNNTNTTNNNNTTNTTNIVTTKAPIYYITSCAKLRNLLASEVDIGKLAGSVMGCPSGGSNYLIVSTCAELIEKFEGQIRQQLGSTIATAKILGLNCQIETPTAPNPRIFKTTFEILPKIIVKRIIVLNDAGDNSEKIITAQIASIGEYVKKIINDE